MVQSYIHALPTQMCPKDRMYARGRGTIIDKGRARRLDDGNETRLDNEEGQYSKKKMQKGTQGC
jgi:hypothetical protein